MKIRGLSICICLSLTGGYAVAAAADDADSVGVVVAVQGTVTIQPATMTPPMRVRQFDEVGPLSILNSQSGSRCKVLYTDDSLVTLGENSRLEITEQTYQAGSDQRAFVAHLIRGAVRALVARSFEGGNSTYEIHAGTSVATARGTYFVIWLNGEQTTTDSRKPGNRFQYDEGGFDTEGASGVANIGRNGNVAFTSGGATVLVLPGQFSIALPGAMPSMPASIQTQIAPVASAISGTSLPDLPRQESPREAFAAASTGGAAGGSAAISPVGPAVAKVGSLGGQAPSGSYMLPDWPFPVTPVTPPAVVSGAALSNTTVNLTIRLP
jgi:FecR-like protein